MGWIQFLSMGARLLIFSKTRVGDSTNFICTEGSASTEAPGEGAVEGVGVVSAGICHSTTKGF